MLSFRTQQVEALSLALIGDFERRIFDHACRCFPAATRPMSDGQLRELLRYGIERAMAHGVRTERGASKYINLMFVFGRDFDRDPRLPWAREILGGARVHRDLSMIELLYREGLAHQDDARGFGGGGG